MTRISYTLHAFCQDWLREAISQESFCTLRTGFGSASRLRSLSSSLQEFLWLAF